MSVFGSSVSGFALPMTAILLLRGTALQMGLLQALAGAPAVLAALPIGVLVDRVHRRRLMIAVDIGRAALMATIPALRIAHRLRMVDLYVVSAAVGVLTVAFDSGCQAFVPELAGRDRLVDANAAMQFSQSVAAMGGPGAAGVLITAVTAPMTLLVDAASFVFSALSLSEVSHLLRFCRARGRGRWSVRRGAGCRIVLDLNGLAAAGGG